MNFNRRRKTRLNKHKRTKKSRPHGLGNHRGRGQKKSEKRLQAKRTRKALRMKNKPLIKH